jgi:sterol desaturase/sphingolipid hydroxylase (fatty acid hydroxylase superfamily)
VVDLTVVAIPGYFGTMGAEYAYTKRRREAGDESVLGYEKQDTLASLAMGVGSLLAPMVMAKVLKPVTPGRGKLGRALVLTAVGAAAVTTAADAVLRRTDDESIEKAADDTLPAGNRARRRKIARLARKLVGPAGMTAVASGVVAGTTTWATRTTAKRLWDHRRAPDLGTGLLATAGAVFAWDFIYYWNHRFMHESRWLWAIHVVHHSSERYNLSTALRQPVADALGAFLPMGALALLGFRPELIETARGVNLLYQYWIHTEVIPKLGKAEEVLNTPSHHRVHHGSNLQYIDRNHGSILIVWDRLFGTFEREDEPVVYGLTKNVGSYHPARIATHEHADILRDVAHSTSWPDRFGYVLRGPGWAYARHAARHEPQPAAGVS